MCRAVHAAMHARLAPLSPSINLLFQYRHESPAFLLCPMYVPPGTRFKLFVGRLLRLATQLTPHRPAFGFAVRVRGHSSVNFCSQQSTTVCLVGKILLKPYNFPRFGGPQPRPPLVRRIQCVGGPCANQCSCARASARACVGIAVERVYFAPCLRSGKTGAPPSRQPLSVSTSLPPRHSRTFAPLPRTLPAVCAACFWTARPCIVGQSSVKRWCVLGRFPPCRSKSAGVSQRARLSSPFALPRRRGAFYSSSAVVSVPAVGPRVDLITASV